jgi:hypothetical protein
MRGTCLGIAVVMVIGVSRRESTQKTESPVAAKMKFGSESPHTECARPDVCIVSHESSSASKMRIIWSMPHETSSRAHRGTRAHR